MTQKTIPENLRNRISEALGKPVPEQMTPTQLMALSKELKEQGHTDLQIELYQVVVGAVPSEEHAAQAEATEKVQRIKSGLTSDRDEKGRRHPSRAKHFMLIATLGVFVIAFLMWNSFRQPTPRRHVSPNGAVATDNRVSGEEVAPEVAGADDDQPNVALGDEGTDEGEPVANGGSGAIPEEPVAPTVPPPQFGAGNGEYDVAPGEDYYGMPGSEYYGEGAGSPDGGPGGAGGITLQGGGGAVTVLQGGGSKEEAQSAMGGMAVIGRPGGGDGKNGALIGGQSGTTTLSPGGSGNRVELVGGMRGAEPVASNRNEKAPSYEAAPATSRARPAVTSASQLRVPRVAVAAQSNDSKAVGKSELSPGDLLEARIEAAPVLAAGLTEAPVSLKDDKGRIWLGVAKLAGASGRAMITLDEVVIGGRLYKVLANVLDKDKVYGVKVEAKDVAPAIASSTLRAAIGGVAEYVKGLQDSTKVYVDSSGNRVEEKQSPSAGWVVAKRISEVYDLPIDDKTISRIFVIKSGEPVKILVRKKPWQPE